MDLQGLADRQISITGGGVSLLVLRDGRVERRILAGEAQPGVPMAEDTLLLWLSSGKPVTAAAIALLHEQGRLDINKEVSNQIPEFAAKGKEAITIRNLLTHTAGLHRVLPGAWEAGEWSAIIERICAAPLPPGFVPGEHAAYDPSAAWLLLGEIIQRVTGETFETFIRREVFDVAGMHDAAFSYDDQRAQELSGRLAQYSSMISGQRHPLAWNSPPTARWPRPGASLRATAAGMARFYQAILDGTLLRPETVSLFTRSARGLQMDRTFGAPMDWGLGFMVKGDPRLPYSFGAHASASSFGHGGQQSSIAYADPEQRRVFVAAYTTLPGERPHNQRMLELMSAAVSEP